MKLQYKQYLYGMLLGMVGCVGLAMGIFIMLVITGTNIDVAHYYTNRPQCKMVYTMGVKDNGHVGIQWQMRCE